jgi:hypothetical protein
VLETLAARAAGLIHMFRGCNPAITAIAISADGRVGVSAHDDWAIRFWDLDHHLLIRQIAKHVTPVLSVAISPDGRRVLSGSGARMIRLWDTRTGAEVRNYVAPAEEVHALAFSPDGKSFLSGWGDGTARLFDPEKREVGRSLMTAPGGRASAVAFTPDGKFAVTGGGTMNERPDAVAASLCLWDLGAGKLVRRFDGHTQDVCRVSVSLDGKQLLSASFDGTVRLWELSTGRELKKLEGAACALAVLTPDGKRAIATLIGGPRDESVLTPKLWDLATGREIRVFKGHRRPVTCFAVSGDGGRLLSGSADGSMGLWELPK